MQNALTISGNNLTLDDIYQVSHKHRPVEIEEKSMELLVNTRKLVFELSDRGVPIYGCNRGVGWNKDKNVTSEMIIRFNSNMMHSHAVGVGPYAPQEDVRAAMLIRLNTVLLGCTGLSPEIALLLKEMLNREIHPLIPERGSVGEADIVNLSFLGLALMGEGLVNYRGKEIKAKDAFKTEGIEPVTLREKDGLAVISSNAFSAGQAASVLFETELLLKTADIIACMSLEGLSGNVSSLREGVHNKRRYNRQTETAADMRKYLKGSYLYEPCSGRPLQDPLSYRCVPQVHGAVRTAMDYAASNLTIQCNSSDDNPCLLYEEGDIASNGNFDPLCWVLGMQNLGIALCHISRLSCLRTIKLASPGFTGLSRHLTPDEGTIAFSTIQKSFANLDAEIRMLANPVTMNTYSLSGDMEDISTNAPLVMQKDKKIIDNLFYILAIELLHAGQAMSLRNAGNCGKGTGAGYKALRRVVDFYDSDNRILSIDIDKAYTLLKSGDFLKSVLNGLED